MRIMIGDKHSSKEIEWSVCKRKETVARKSNVSSRTDCRQLMGTKGREQSEIDSFNVPKKENIICRPVK